MDFDELKKIHATWTQESGDLRKLAWSDFSAVSGEGSDVLCAVRDCADPATKAAESIAARFSAMADVLATFSASMEALDAASAEELRKLVPR
ncbi:hypothetical protein [Nocardia otitidiscaviarum]|uniref:hypothetical protein n=1 Tax=Nocardia otitidiscaviarum TaxID=1823 RepID=UPI001895FFF6|nr:hypothetical protein [Nocardia otitidiscaviarum]MBF6183220.1 hypothetical protein [Nocardia otitidiscaviarum]